MKKLPFYILLILLFSPLNTYAQIVIDFDTKDYKSIGVYDSWQDSPFRKGLLPGNIAVVENQLAFQRSRYAGNLFGARIDLNSPFELTSNYLYVHIYIKKPKAGRAMLIGLGKRIDRDEQSPEVEQFHVLSTSTVRPGDWVDAVFRINGNGGILIYSLVVIPDCESTHNLDEDFLVYMDAIEINNSSSQRLGKKLYPISLDKNKEVANEKQLSQITFTGDKDSYISIPSDPDNNKVYQEYFDYNQHVLPGETLTPEFMFIDTESQLQGYTYIDLDEIGDFKSEQAKQSAFTIPAETTPGIYRMRIKTDQEGDPNPEGNSTNPDLLATNGGNIFDILLNVHSEKSHVNVISRNGDVLAADSSYLSNTEIPWGESFEILMDPENRFEQDGVTLLYGHLQRDSLINENPQYKSVYIPADLFSNNRYTIPSEYIIGDLAIIAEFQEGNNIETVSVPKDLRISAGRNKLIIQTTQSVPATICDLSGRILYQFTVKGTKEILLPPGIYLVNDQKAQVY